MHIKLKQKIQEYNSSSPIYQGEQSSVILMIDFVEFLKLSFAFFVVAIFDLVHDVDAIFHHPYVLTASENLSEIRVMLMELLIEVSPASLTCISKKRFPDIVSS